MEAKRIPDHYKTLRVWCDDVCLSYKSVDQWRWQETKYGVSICPYIVKLGSRLYVDMIQFEKFVEDEDPEFWLRAEQRRARK